MNSKMKHMIIGVFALALIVASVFVMVPVNDAEDSKEVSFGLPFGFIGQDFYQKYEKSIMFPWGQNIDLKMPIKSFGIGNFFLSFLAVFIGLEILIFILENIKWRIGEFFRRKKESKE